MITTTKQGRTWFLTAGACKLPGRFRTESAALEALAASPEFYRYWAESLGVSVLNSTPRTVQV